jgi:hypothetical protein
MQATACGQAVIFATGLIYSDRQRETTIGRSVG